MSRLDRAKSTLRHYLENATGSPLSSDSVQEIDSILDDVVAHVLEEINRKPPVPIGSRRLR